MSEATPLGLPVHPRGLEAPRSASAAERPCELYLDHGSARPVVTQGHHVLPLYLQWRKWGEYRSEELLWLCGGCHDSVHAWIYHLMGERYQPPKPPARAVRRAELTVAWFREAA